MVTSISLPLRVILICSALTQIYAYVTVVLYSLWIGPTDLAIPVKCAFIATVFIVIALAVNDLRTDFKNRNSNLPQVGLSVYRLIVELALLVGLIYVAFKFLPQPLSSVDMRTLSIEVKAVASVSIAALVAFSVMVIADLWELKRRGGVPTISGANRP